MYNGLIIERMLIERKLKKKDMQDALGITYNSYKTTVYGNPTVKTLEPVADFFKVSMDVFFKREISLPKEVNNIGAVNGNGNKVQQGHMNVIQESQEKEIEHLRMRLEEKDRLLEEKERTIQILMNK